VLASAPAASADSSICNSDRSSCVEFQSYGEVWTVHDYKSNGRSTLVIVDLNRDGVGLFAYWNDLGYDAPPRKVDDEYPEGVALSYRACEGYLSTSEVFNCSPWRNDVA